MRGTVKRLLVNTVGGVVQPGKDVIEIVPLDDALILEARVKPKDIAFLRPQQPAVVKFSAYDFAIYGGLDAVLPVQSRSRIFLHKSPSAISIRINTSRFIHNDPADQRRMMLQKFHIFSVNICKSLRPFIC